MEGLLWVAFENLFLLIIIYHINCVILKNIMSIRNCFWEGGTFSEFREGNQLGKVIWRSRERIHQRAQRQQQAQHRFGSVIFAMAVKDTSPRYLLILLQLLQRYFTRWGWLWMKMKDSVGVRRVKTSDSITRDPAPLIQQAHRAAKS